MLPSTPAPATAQRAAEAQDLPGSTYATVMCCTPPPLASLSHRSAGTRVNRKVRIVARPRVVLPTTRCDALHEGAVNVGLRRRDVDGIFTLKPPGAYR